MVKLNLFNYLLIDNPIFDLTYQEVKLLVTQFHSQPDVITDAHERFLIYEAFKRNRDNLEPYTMKWIEQTLRFSFPKTYSMVNKLVGLGYLQRVRSSSDKRIMHIMATQKLLKGVQLYEGMKLNELSLLGLTSKKANNKPSLTEFNRFSPKEFLKFKKEFLDDDDSVIK